MSRSGPMKNVFRNLSWRKSDEKCHIFFLYQLQRTFSRNLGDAFSLPKSSSNMKFLLFSFCVDLGLPGFGSETPHSAQPPGFESSDSAYRWRAAGACSRLDRSRSSQCFSSPSPARADTLQTKKEQNQLIRKQIKLQGCDDYSAVVSWITN